MSEEIKSITRSFQEKPTIVQGTIAEDCMFENSILGIGTIIIDKEFINYMTSMADSLELGNNLLNVFTAISNNINNYFYSKDENELSRESTYDDNLVVDEDGMIIGTKMSALKGKNVALCSEKSIAAYITFKHLYDTKRITRIPSLVTSNLTVDGQSEPHAFLLIEKENAQYPTKCFLYDAENPTQLRDTKGNDIAFAGVYSLTDEESENLKNGNVCSPKSIYEIVGNYKEIGPKRYYGYPLKEEKFFRP